MSTWKQSAVVEILYEGARELARMAWRQLTGDDDTPDARRAIEEITERVLGDWLEKFEQRFEQQAQQLALVVGLVDVADRAKDVLDAFRVKGEFPRILDGADIEIVKE